MNIQLKLNYIGNEIEIEGSLLVGYFNSGSLVGTLGILWSYYGVTCTYGRQAFV